MFINNTMVKKTAKVEGANLTSQQKADIKKMILSQFPNLAIFAEDLEFLIDEYSKDKKYVNKLMEVKNPAQQLLDESKVETIKIIKKGTEEWRDIIEKMDKAKTDFVKVGDEVEEDTKTKS